MMRQPLLICLLLCCLAGRLQGQSLPDSSGKRIPWVNGGLLLTYGGTMGILYNFWYRNYPMESFHFFNDNAEWLQVDKIGHGYSAYQGGRLGVKLYRWAGMPEKKAVWLGGSVGSVFLSTVEILDGFSSEWGFSWGDIAANTGGSALLIAQELAWKEQRITMKYSFGQTGLSSYRPNMLGSNLPEEALKDYNGQSYWLSANLKSLCLPRQKAFPAWLNLAVGYGAQGMLGARNNQWVDSKSGLSYNYDNVSRYRQWYLSPDIDWTRIKTRSKALKTVFFVLNAFKLPAPALELNKRGFKWHLFYY